MGIKGGPKTFDDLLRLLGDGTTAWDEPATSEGKPPGDVGRSSDVTKARSHVSLEETALALSGGVVSDDRTAGDQPPRHEAFGPDRMTQSRWDP